MYLWQHLLELVAIILYIVNGYESFKTNLQHLQLINRYLTKICTFFNNGLQYHTLPLVCNITLQ